MRKLLYLLASAAVMAGGCSEKKETPAGEGCGTIRIACEADATIDAAAAMAAVQGATRAAAKPDGKDFTLRIRGENFDKSWATVAAYNAEETAYSFPEGRYAITVTYGDPEAEGADKPYYAGATEVEVAARRTSTAQITATIGNAQTLVRATESFKKYYNNAEFTVTTGAGSIFTFRPCDAAEAEAVWVQAGKPLTLKGTARGQSQDGTSEGPLYTFTPRAARSGTPSHAPHLHARRQEGRQRDADRHPRRRIHRDRGTRRGTQRRGHRITQIKTPRYENLYQDSDGCGSDGAARDRLCERRSRL